MTDEHAGQYASAVDERAVAAAVQARHALRVGVLAVKLLLALLSLPASTALIAIRRAQETFDPTAGTRLQRGDRLTLLVPASQAEAVVDDPQHALLSGTRDHL